MLAALQLVLGGQSVTVFVQFPFPSHMSAEVTLLVFGSQDWGAPQPVPIGFGSPSTQVNAPVEHDVTPTLQRWPGLVSHDRLAVQATQVPALLHTMFVPQDVPVVSWVLLLQTMVPVLQLVMPVKQGFGLLVQLWLGVHAPQVPLPSQTWFVPQLVPADLLVLPSTHFMAPVVHDVVPFLQTLGLVVHELPAVHATQMPLPLQT